MKLTKPFEILGKTIAKIIDPKIKSSGIGAVRETVIAKVLSTRYRNTSSYGNPSYYVTLEDENGNILEGYTAPNASIGYGIQNSNNFENYKKYTYHWSKNNDIVIHS